MVNALRGATPLCSSLVARGRKTYNQTSLSPNPGIVLVLSSSFPLFRNSGDTIQQHKLYKNGGQSVLKFRTNLNTLAS